MAQKEEKIEVEGEIVESLPSTMFRVQIDGLVHPVDLHPEHRARERLDDLAFDLDLLFFLSHLPHRNRARRARLGTRKNTAFAAGANGSKRIWAQISHFPLSWTTFPSNSRRPPSRRSLTMSQC